MKTVGELKAAILKLNPALKYCPSYIVFYEEYTKIQFKNGFTWLELFRLPDHLSLLESDQLSNGSQGTLVVCEFGRNPLAEIVKLSTIKTAKTKKKVIVHCKITEDCLLSISIGNLIK